MRNSRSIFIPSKKTFIRFCDFTNEHLMLMSKTEDSIIDSIYSQIDIIHDCIIGDSSIVDELTIIDYLAIFLTWRINCIDDQLTLDADITNNSSVDLAGWLVDVCKTADMDLSKTIDIEVSDECSFKIECNVPTMSDVAEVYKNNMLESDFTQQSVNINRSIHTSILINRVDGNAISPTDKIRLFDNLPVKSSEDITEYSLFVSDKLHSTELMFDINGDSYEFNMDIIPAIIRLLVSSSSEVIIKQGLFMTKQAKFTWDSFMSLTPIDTEFIMMYINEQNKPDDENDTAEGYPPLY